MAYVVGMISKDMYIKRLKLYDCLACVILNVYSYWHMMMMTLMCDFEVRIVKLCGNDNSKRI